MPSSRAAALVLLLALGLLPGGCASTASPMPPDPAPPLRERAAVRDAWLLERLDTLLPRLMGEAGIDLWIVSAREYAEDPVLRTLLPATWLSARRRTVLLMHDRGGGRGVERAAMARYDVGAAFPGAWDPDQQPDQLAAVARWIAARDPARIGVNTSRDFAHADGLTHSEHEALVAALRAAVPEEPERLVSRLVSAEPLAVGWLQTRTEAEARAYEELCRAAHALIAEAFSRAVITPGETTTEDVTWWLRERIAALGYATWFHPDVSLQRREAAGHDGDFSDDPAARVIRRGDLLHVDVGLSAFGLDTDTQRHAYVLRAGETAPPAGLADGLAAGNRLQDLLLAEFRAGRPGNAVLASALAAARAEGLRPMIYTHPLGAYGHGPGATIGMWDRQDGVPGPGDVPLAEDTVWAIELNVAVDVPGWDDQTVRIMLEEDALFADGAVRFLDGRQQRLLVIE